MGVFFFLLCWKGGRGGEGLEVVRCGRKRGFLGVRGEGLGCEGNKDFLGGREEERGLVCGGRGSFYFGKGGVIGCEGRGVVLGLGWGERKGVEGERVRYEY